MRVWKACNGSFGGVRLRAPGTGHTKNRVYQRAIFLSNLNCCVSTEKNLIHFVMQ